MTAFAASVWYHRSSEVQLKVQVCLVGNDELITAPVLVAAVGEVPADDDGDLSAPVQNKRQTLSDQEQNKMKEFRQKWNNLMYFSSFMAICKGSVSPSNSTITGAHMLSAEQRQNPQNKSQIEVKCHYFKARKQAGQRIHGLFIHTHTFQTSVSLNGPNTKTQRCQQPGSNPEPAFKAAKLRNVIQCHFDKMRCKDFFVCP